MADDIRSQIAMVRKTTHNFGVCLGKKPENTALVFDRRKPPEGLMRIAKKSDNVMPAKSGCGTADAKGSKITLTFATAPMPAAAKQLKAYFVKNGLKMKVTVIGPDGAVEEEGDDDDNEAAAAPDAAPPSRPPAEDPTDRNRRPERADTPDTAPPTDAPASSGGIDPKLVAAIAALRQRAGALAAAPLRDDLIARLDAAQSMADAGDDGALRDTLREVRDRITATQEAEQRWQAARDKVAPALDGLAGDAAQGVRDAWARVVGQATQGDYAGAISALTPLVAQIKSLRDAAAMAALDDDVRPYAAARAEWTRARAKIGAELDRLKLEIARACEGHEALAPVAGSVGDLDRHVAPLDDRLDAAIAAVVSAAAGPAREAFKADARKIVAAYRSELGAPFFAAVDTANGFADVAVAATAREALDRIDAALA